MGAVFVRKSIYDAFMQGPENAIELFHGYTYSAHPVACAAGLAAQKIFKRDGLFARAKELSGYWEDAVHSLRGSPHVIDIRNLGLVAGIELESRPGAPGARAFDAFRKAFERGALIRVTGDVIALSPPLIIEKPQIDELIGILGDVLREVE
jgi:beta-alanine--pyruvate transaminase